MVEFAKLFDRLTFQSNTFLVECFPIFFSVFFKKSRPRPLLFIVIVLFKYRKMYTLAGFELRWLE